MASISHFRHNGFPDLIKKVRTLILIYGSLILLIMFMISMVAMMIKCNNKVDIQDILVDLD